MFTSAGPEPLSRFTTRSLVSHVSTLSGLCVGAGGRELARRPTSRRVRDRPPRHVRVSRGSRERSRVAVAWGVVGGRGVRGQLQGDDLQLQGDRNEKGEPRRVPLLFSG